MTQIASPAGSEASLDRIDALRLAVVRLERKLRKHAGTEATPSQLSALFALQRHGALRPGELAEKEQIGKSTTTSLITRLEEKRLIAKTVDPSDARSYLIDLTDQGRTLLREAADKSNDHLRGWIEQLDPDAQRHIFDAVEDLHELASYRR